MALTNFAMFTVNKGAESPAINSKTPVACLLGQKPLLFIRVIVPK